MKKFYFLLIALLCSATMLFAYDAQIDGIYYNLNSENKTAEVTHDGTYSNSNGAGYTQSEVVIPKKVTYNSVEYSVTSIGNNAFYKCSSLISVTIPKGITSIGGYAFYKCSALKSITIPSSITSIKYDAFWECHALKSVNISDIAAWCNIDFSSNPLSFAKNLYLNGELVTSLEIPEGVDSIKNSAFSGCSSLTSIILPNSVTSIGSYTFNGCSSLISITIPNSVTSIGSSAFSGCSSLDSIVVESITPPTLGGSIVSSKKDVYIYIPDGTKSAYQTTWGEDYLFINNETFVTVNVENPGTLSDLIFDAGTRPAYVIKLVVTGTLNSSDFTCMRETMTSLIDVDLSGITNTSGVNFYNKSNLIRVVLPKNLTSLGSLSYYEDGVFEYCSSLKSIIIPDGVTTIGYSAFYSCKALKSIVIPNNVETIGRSAFSFCNLESVTIGSSVTSIGEKAFSYGSSDTIIFLGMNPPSASNLELSASSCKLIVPTEAYNDYLRHSYWGQFLTIWNVKVTTSVNNTEWGEVTGDGYYTENNVVTLTANPANGYHFEKWDDGNTENPRSFVITQDTSFTAEFALNSYTISIENALNGIVTGMGEYNHGDTVTLTAIANEHYHFVQWSDGNVENPRIFVATNDTTFSAEFAIDKHEVVLLGDNGTLYGSGSYAYGDSVEIKAVANDGYNFVRWSDGNTENPRTIVVTQDTTFSAVFAMNVSKLELDADISLSSSEVTMTSYFYLSTTVKNVGENDFTGDLAIGLYDLNENFIVAIEPSEYTISKGSNSYVSLWNFSDNIVVPTGNYYVGIVYKVGNDWRLIKSSNYSALKYLSVTYNDQLELYSFAISQDKLYSYGSIDVTIDILNTSYEMFYGMYRVSLCNLDGSVIKNLGVKYENSGLNYNYHYPNGLTFSSTLDVEPGLYVLQVGYKRSGTDSWYYIGTTYTNAPVFIEVLDPNKPEEEPIYKDKYEANNSVEEAYNLSYQLNADTAYIQLNANIHTPESEYHSNDVDYYSITTETGYYYEIDVIAYDKYNQNEEYNLTGDVLLSYVHNGYFSNEYDDAMNIFVEGGSDITLCVTPYINSIVGTYELAISIKRAKIQYYEVNVIAQDPTMGAVYGSGLYREYDVVYIEAIPNEHYHFVQWSDGNTENPRSIVVTEDVDLRAEFAINQYEVYVMSDENGYATIGGNGIYNYGEEVTIEAIANEGYHFVEWSDGNTENPRTIVVTGYMVLIAEFAIDQYEVNVTADKNGIVTGGGTYNYGEEVTIEAIANEGYHFVKWSDDNTENPRTIVVTENVELTAEFELDGTPVEDVNELSVIVYVRGGMLYIDGVETDYNVFDASGRLIYTGRESALALPRGVYVVVVGDEVEKVVL